jgi:hypothetical protein
MHNGKRIWFEATSPICGKPGSPGHIGETEGLVAAPPFMTRSISSPNMKAASGGST